MTTRILVIEDNPTNMELASYVLEAFGYAVTQALDGETGVELARAAPPDLVICDMQLPGIDGIEVAKQLRAQPALSHVPLVAVTAYAMLGDRERLLAAGFDGYISKPIDPRTFVPQVAAFLKSAPPARAPLDTSTAGAANAAPPMRARALVLDDTAANTELLRVLLEPHGIAVEAVSHIEEALSWLAHQKPELIISDLHLHNERGEDFYSAVRARPELKAVPFVFISSTMLHDVDRRNALANGADRFLVRPIDSARLITEIENCLALSKAS
jgi:two-component system, cell cycle response regulator